MSRIASTGVASVYPHYVHKVERKGGTTQELREANTWLTGYDDDGFDRHLADGTTFEDFSRAGAAEPGASSITGTVCGVRCARRGRRGPAGAR